MLRCWSRVLPCRPPAVWSACATSPAAAGPVLLSLCCAVLWSGSPWPPGISRWGLCCCGNSPSPGPSTPPGRSRTSRTLSSLCWQVWDTLPAVHGPAGGERALPRLHHRAVLQPGLQAHRCPAPRGRVQGPGPTGKATLYLLVPSLFSVQVGSGLNVHPFLAYRLVVRAGRAAVLAERAGLDSGVETAGCTGDTGKLYCSDDWTQVQHFLHYPVMYSTTGY